MLKATLPEKVKGRAFANSEILKVISMSLSAVGGGHVCVLGLYVYCVGCMLSVCVVYASMNVGVSFICMWM